MAGYQEGNCSHTWARPTETRDEGIQFRPINFPGATNFNCQLEVPLVQNKNLDKNFSRSAFEPAFVRPRRLRYATGTAGHSRVNYHDIQVLKVNYLDVLDLQ